MITLNGNKFALNDNEFINSLFDTGNTCVGYYKPYKNNINLLDMQKVKIGVVTRHKVLALATKKDNGKWWYSYGDLPLVGAYKNTTQKYNEINTALLELKP